MGAMAIPVAPANSAFNAKRRPLSGVVGRVSGMIDDRERLWKARQDCNMVIVMLNHNSFNSFPNNQMKAPRHNFVKLVNKIDCLII
jgi:hypothetical protein